MLNHRPPPSAQRTSATLRSLPRCCRRSSAAAAQPAEGRILGVPRRASPRHLGGGRRATCIGRSTALSRSASAAQPPAAAYSAAARTPAAEYHPCPGPLHSLEGGVLVVPQLAKPGALGLAIQAPSCATHLRRASQPLGAEFSRCRGRSFCATQHRPRLPRHQRLVREPPLGDARRPLLRTRGRPRSMVKAPPRQWPSSAPAAS